MISEDRAHPVVLRRLEVSHTFLITLSCVVASVIFFAWTQPGVAAGMHANWSLMKVNTAVCVLLCAASAAFANRPHHATSRPFSVALAAIAIAIAGVAMFEHVTQISTGFNTWIADDPGAAYPGLMSSRTAACISLIGVSLLIGHRAQGRRGQLLDAVQLVLLTVVLILVEAYIFRAMTLVGRSRNLVTSPHTLACVAMLTAVVVGQRAPYGWLSAFVLRGMGSQFARRILPLAVVVSSLIIIATEHMVSSGAMDITSAAAFTAAGIGLLLLLQANALARRLNELEQDLHDLSITDALTQILNNRGFHLLAEQALLDARRTGSPATLLFFDADGLKATNDAHGHQMGSDMLVEIAALLSKSYRNNDVIGRFGGDEFVVFAHGTGEEVQNATDRLDEAIASANRTRTKPYQISLSRGIATVDPSAPTGLEELVRYADALMYADKRNRAGRTG